jgi:hypothetical protein
MAETWKSPSDDWAVPLFWFLSVILAGAACLFLLLHSAYRPTVTANPGIADYTPPPGTRLIPLPRKSDAPELAELRAEPPFPLGALAQANASEKQAKRDARPPALKRPRVAPHDNDQRSRDWNNNRAWSGVSRTLF